jgi:hypothetical protein
LERFAKTDILGEFWDEEKLLEYAMTDPKFRERLREQQKSDVDSPMMLCARSVKTASDPPLAV